MEKIEHFWKFHNKDSMDVHTVKLINELEAENKRLWEAPKGFDFAINCGAMGKGDDSCPGCIYWSADGKLLCNECGAEYELKEVKP